MACFLVPTTEAIVTTVIKHKAAHEETVAEARGEIDALDTRIPWKTKLSWLNNMLWGGAVLLALEHIWHGEVVLYPPFLTAMNNSADTMAMLREMGTVGLGMAGLVTAVWFGLCAVSDRSRSIRAIILGEKA